MFKQTLFVASLGAVLSTSMVFASNTGHADFHAQAEQYKAQAQQLKTDHQQHRDEIKSEYANSKATFTGNQAPLKNDLKTFMRSFDKQTLSGVKAQIQLMNQEITTTRASYQSGNNTTGGLSGMYQDIKAIKTRYEASIKALLPQDKQAQYQTLIDAINTLHDNYMSEMEHKKDELIANKNEYFSGKTQLKQDKYTNLIQARLTKLSTKNPTAYQAYVTKLRTSITTKLDKISTAKNISAANKQARIDLYTNMLNTIDQNIVTTTQQNVISDNTLTESVQ